MKIGHIAIWTRNLEALRSFYTVYFNGRSNSKYTNTAKGFESYFIRFEGNVTLELMTRENVRQWITCEILGICHLAFTLHSEEAVRELTERLRNDGYTIAGEPRTSGDGYYESVILDPDGNRIELVAERNDI